MRCGSSCVFGTESDHGTHSPSSTRTCPTHGGAENPIVSLSGGHTMPDVNAKTQCASRHSLQPLYCRYPVERCASAANQSRRVVRKKKKISSECFAPCFSLQPYPTVTIVPRQMLLLTNRTPNSQDGGNRHREKCRCCCCSHIGSSVESSSWSQDILLVTEEITKY